MVKFWPFIFFAIFQKNKIQHSLIIVAEAVKKEDGSKVMHKYLDGEKRLGGIGDYIASEIMKKTDIECRVTTLGHVQRGAPPTANDRILASAFGVYAVDLLANKKFNRMVAWNNRRVVDVAIDEGIKTYRDVQRDDPLVETALSLGKDLTYVRISLLFTSWNSQKSESEFLGGRKSEKLAR